MFSASLVSFNHSFLLGDSLQPTTLFDEYWAIECFEYVFWLCVSVLVLINKLFSRDGNGSFSKSLYFKYEMVPSFGLIL